MFNAIGNNFGAGEIRFKSYQQPTYAILNTRFFMDTTSQEYQAADVLEITVPKLSIDRSTDSVALIVFRDRRQSYGSADSYDAGSAARSWIKDDHTICIEKLACMEGKGKLCVYIYSMYIQLNQGLPAERHSKLALNVTPSPICCEFYRDSFIVVKEKWVFLYIGKGTTPSGGSYQPWEGVVDNLPTDIQAIVPFYGGNNQYNYDYTAISEVTLKAGKYIHPYRTPSNSGTGIFGYFVRGDNQGEVIPDIPMADDVTRCRLIIKNEETMTSSYEADFVIEGCTGPINVGVVGKFVSPGVNGYAGYNLNEQSKKIPGGSFSVVCRTNAGHKLAIYDATSYSELNNSQRNITCRCSAARYEEVEVFDTSVYTYSGTR